MGQKVVYRLNKFQGALRRVLLFGGFFCPFFSGPLRPFGLSLLPARLCRKDGQGEEPQQPQAQGKDLPPPNKLRLYRGKKRQGQKGQKSQCDISSHRLSLLFQRCIQGAALDPLLFLLTKEAGVPPVSRPARPSALPWQKAQGSAWSLSWQGGGKAARRAPPVTFGKYRKGFPAR